MASDEHCTHLDPSECDGTEHHYGRATDITDVLTDNWVTVIAEDGYPSMRTTTAEEKIRNLAAATADGPLVEDVECPNCLDGVWVNYSPETKTHTEYPCPTCHGSGTVRLVVHRADPALANKLRALVFDMDLYDDGEATRWLRAAARIIGGEK
jgi:hypothetical protein